MAKFIVATNRVDTDKINAITNYLKGKQYGYWHHFGDLWLLVGIPDEYSAHDLYNDIISNVRLLMTDHILVTRIDEPISHWGVAPTGAWVWMAKHWGAGK